MPKIFFSYSHKDEVFRDQLEVHLSSLKRQKVIESWHDRKIIAGSVIDDVIDRHLNGSDVILLLISPDFIASDYCYDKEVQRALQRHSEGTARVIPVILRPCDWHNLPFGKLLATPTDGRAITLWLNHDEAFLAVVTSIKAALRELTSPPSEQAPTRGLPPIVNPVLIDPTPQSTAEVQHVKTERPLSGRSAEAISNLIIEAKRRPGSSPRCPSIGIDIGTKSTRIYIQGQGIALNEPSIVALDSSRRKVVAAGNGALDLIKPMHHPFWAIRPLEESIISEPDSAVQMLRHFLDQLGVVSGSRAVFSVPAVATNASLKVLYDVAKRTKLGKIEFAQRTLLAAFGKGVQGEAP